MDPKAIPAALARLRDALSGPGGVVATTDPSTLVPPGAWVVPQEIPEDGWTLTGPAYLNVRVYLIAGSVGVPEAHDILGGLLAKTLAVLTPDGPVTTATAVTLPDNPTPQPAYLVPVQLEL